MSQTSVSSSSQIYGKTFPVTDSNFSEEVLKSKSLVLVDFWAAWCGPCRAIAPTLEQVAQEMPTQVKICKLDVDVNQNSAAQYQIRSIPTLLLFKNGSVVDQIMGRVSKEILVATLNKHL